MNDSASHPTPLTGAFSASSSATLPRACASRNARFAAPSTAYPLPRSSATSALSRAVSRRNAAASTWSRNTAASRGRLPARTAANSSRPSAGEGSQSNTNARTRKPFVRKKSAAARASFFVAATLAWPT